MQSPDYWDRFWSKVDASGDCWEWTSTRVGPGGYGRLWVSGSRLAAHRISWAMLVGPLDEREHLDHLCRNRGCVNPDHLEPVTAGQNVLRGYGPPAKNARKVQCDYGHPLYGENLEVRSGGKRACRECRRRQSREYERRRPRRTR